MSKRNEAIRLRLQGKSYGEIMKALAISSKGTLSYWFHDLSLSAVAKSRLQANIARAQRQGFFAFNEKRSKKIRAENKAIYRQSAAEIPALSLAELRLIGAALYWGEGINRVPSRGYTVVSFTNSDPRMVKIFLRYVREVLKVSEEKIKPGVIIYPALDPQKAKNFWAHIAKLPQESFWVTVAISKSSKMKKPSNYLPYGTLHIRVNSRKIYHTIQGHITGIIRGL